MLPHPLTDFEIQKHCQNEPRFNGVYSRDNLPRIKDEAYVINLDEHSDTGTHWVALYVQNNVIYFDSFRVEHIFRIQAYDSIMCGYSCIGFIDFMLAEKTLTDFTNLFLPYNFKRNDDIILNYFITNV